MTSLSSIFFTIFNTYQEYDKSKTSYESLKTNTLLNNSYFKNINNYFRKIKNDLKDVNSYEHKLIRKYELENTSFVILNSPSFPNLSRDTKEIEQMKKDYNNFINNFSEASSSKNSQKIFGYELYHSFLKKLYVLDKFFHHVKLNDFKNEAINYSECITKFTNSNDNNLLPIHRKKVINLSKTLYFIQISIDELPEDSIDLKNILKNSEDIDTMNLYKKVNYYYEKITQIMEEISTIPY
ncbi:hypothetical protein [Staphylococcus capitis]|jgi:hypothetical protein|uniref:hypothetical protein n=1 Tax=Staphylococcus capitis TaxID=29388 RepID=UPI0037D37960